MLNGKLRKLREAFQGGLGRAVTQLDQHQVTALALDQRPHGTPAARPLDVILSQSPRAGRAHNSMGRRWMEIIFGNVPRRSWPLEQGAARPVGKAQLRDELATQFPPWHGIDGTVDHLVGDVHRIVRIHPPQSARDQLRRPNLRHQGGNPAQQQRTGLKLHIPAQPQFATSMNLTPFVHRPLAVVISNVYTVQNQGLHFSLEHAHSNSTKRQGEKYFRHSGAKRRLS